MGKWTLLKFGSEVLAVHAALLPTGKVLFAAGSGNSTVRFHYNFWEHRTAELDERAVGSRGQSSARHTRRNRWC
jgi:hypothetical protein